MSVCDVTKSLNHKWFIVFIAHIISLPNVTLCNNICFIFATKSKKYDTTFVVGCGRDVT